MIDNHSKYDNMHRNGIFYALICINNHVLSCLISMLSTNHNQEIVYRDEKPKSTISLDSNIASSKHSQVSLPMNPQMHPKVYTAMSNFDNMQS